MKRSLITLAACVALVLATGGTGLAGLPAPGPSGRWSRGVVPIGAIRMTAGRRGY